MRDYETRIYLPLEDAPMIIETHFEIRNSAVWCEETLNLFVVKYLKSCSQISIAFSL